MTGLRGNSACHGWHFSIFFTKIIRYTVAKKEDGRGGESLPSWSHPNAVHLGNKKVVTKRKPHSGELVCLRRSKQDASVILQPSATYRATNLHVFISKDLDSARPPTLEYSRTRNNSPLCCASTSCRICIVAR